MKSGKKRWSYAGVYFFFWFGYNVIMPYLGIILQAKGLSASFIGSMTGIGNLASVVATVIGGIIADKYKKPGPVVSLMALIMIVVSALIYKSRSPLILFSLFIVFKLFEAPINGITDRALMIEIKDEPEIFAKYRSLGTIGAGVGILLVAYLFKDNNYKPVFIAFGLITLPCIICAINFKKHEYIADNQDNKLALSDYKQIFSSKYSLPIYLSFTIWGIAECGCGTFMPMIVQNGGLPTTSTSFFVALTMIGEFVSFLFVPQIIKKLSRRSVFIIALLLQFTRMLSLSLIGKIPLLVVAFFQMIGGASFAMISSIITLLVDLVYSEKILYSAHLLKSLVCSGVGGALGELFLGIMFERGAGRMSYIVISSLCFFSAICFMLYRKLDLELKKN